MTENFSKVFGINPVPPNLSPLMPKILNVLDKAAAADGIKGMVGYYDRLTYKPIFKGGPKFSSTFKLAEKNLPAGELFMCLEREESGELYPHLAIIPLDETSRF